MAAPPQSTGEGYLQKELRTCRAELQQAERRAAGVLDSRDSLSLKLEAARDEAAELQRQLEVAVRIPIE
jgi:phage shock protein A